MPVVDRRPRMRKTKYAVELTEAERARLRTLAGEEHAHIDARVEPAHGMAQMGHTREM